MTVWTSRQLSRRTVWTTPSVSGRTNIQSETYFNAFRVHLVVLFWFGPVQAGITFLVDEQIRVVDLFELQFDRLHELLGYKFRCLATYTGHE